jgi:hypothetical protein
MRSRMLVSCTTLVFAFCAGVTTAATFAGGTGEPNDPYQVATAEQLMSVSSDPNLHDKCFILTDDIDLDPTLPGREVFLQAVLQWSVTVTSSVGSSTVSATSPLSFEGRFDGNGHVVRNGVICAARNGGFFLSIGTRGTVYNLHLENVFVGDLDSPYDDTTEISFTTKTYRGALAGVNGGTISECSATGTVLAIIMGEGFGGGLIGENLGLVSGSHADCQVTGYGAGGLVGINETRGQVISCSSDGLVYGASDTGGLVCINAGTVQRCGTTSYVWGASVGGMISRNEGTVRESRAAATIINSSDYPSLSSAFHLPSSGGLVCENDGNVENCYATGAALPGVTYDGLVSLNLLGTVSMCYSTSPSLATGGLAPVKYVYYLDPNKPQDQTYDPYTYGRGIPLSPEEMKQRASFIGWDFHTVWTICEGRDYPRLKWENIQCP